MVARRSQTFHRLRINTIIFVIDVHNFQVLLQVDYEVGSNERRQVVIGLVGRMVVNDLDVWDFDGACGRPCAVHQPKDDYGRTHDERIGRQRECWPAGSQVAAIPGLQHERKK